MKKLLFVGFYELKDYMVHIKEQFESYNIMVDVYPLFKYAYDAHDKFPNYSEHMNNYIIESDPDIILWWFIDVPVDVFKFIRTNNPKRYFIMYNTDDPVNLNKEFFDKAKIFDLISTPCYETMRGYHSLSHVDNVVYGPFGYDAESFYPIKDDMFDEEKKEFETDISMIVYNLYLDESIYNSQTVYRKTLIENVIMYCKENDKVFKLYGTPVLREFFPDNYAGEVPYYKLNLLYNFSKINLLSSPFNNKIWCLGEYLFSILGSGGVVLIDDTKELNSVLTDNHDCFIYNSDNYLEKINYILNDCDYIDKIKSNTQTIACDYTWKKWVRNIVVEIGKHYFHAATYKNIYDIKGTDNEVLQHWIDKGIDQKYIPYKITIPSNFNADDYISSFGIRNNDVYAYLHWYQNSKNMAYMTRQRSLKSFNPDNYGVLMENYFDICHILNKIGKYNRRDEGLDELKNIVDYTPYIKINEIINSYINS